MEPEEFFELVQPIRRRVQDSHGTIPSSRPSRWSSSASTASSTSSDDSLSAAVNVSTVDEDNFLVDLEVDLADAQADLDEDEIEDDPDAIGFRSVLVDFDPGGRLN